MTKYSGILINAFMESTMALMSLRHLPSEIRFADILLNKAVFLSGLAFRHILTMK
jgi:hypothetical protein